MLEISRRGLWTPLTDRCQVFISEVVVDEAQFYEDESGRQYVDLMALADSGRITILEASVPEVKAFRERFGPDYFARLDAGEA